MLRTTLALLTVVIGVLPAAAVDLAAIRREIAKEPAYHGQPKYCLLVFGKEADTRIWLVLDGNTLHVDRNGNGDLTEPDEKVTGANGNFTINRLVERDGTVHNNFQLSTNAKGEFWFEVGSGQRQQYVGVARMERPSWGDKPASAPIIHLNGPMTFERYGPIYTIPRGAGNSTSVRFSLRVMLGTPGLGKGTFASYDEVCSENLGRVQADIVYASPCPGGVPVTQRIELEHEG